MTQDEALKVLKTGANVFLTGEPGSGKTYTINSYVRWLREHGIEPAITASTGIAATHIGGMTIHSWSGIGVRDYLTEWDVAEIADKSNVKRRAKGTEVLIIDEVSMLSGSILEMVDMVLRASRERTEPFGGMQVVLVGDFFQLPPIVRRGSEPSIDYDESNSPFAFRSRAWHMLNPIVCYLSEQHRQSDAPFTQLLGAIRRGGDVEKAKQTLKSRSVREGDAPPDAPRLFSHNKDVDHLNTKRLQSMAGKPHAYTMTSHGPESIIANLKRGCLSPETLTLKQGARVMFTKNDLAGGAFANGTLGEVTAIATDGVPTVRTVRGSTIVVEPMEWVIGDSGRILGRITQLPLRLAWAITVHKSQGMTLDEAVIDLREAFEYGQGYVALSRVRSLSGLHVLGWNDRALETHPEVQEHDMEFKRRSADVRAHFGMMNSTDHIEHMHRFIKAAGGSIEGGVAPKKKKERTTKKGDSHASTLTLARAGKSIAEIAKERGLKQSTVIDHVTQLYMKDEVTKEQIMRMISPALKRALSHIEVAFKRYGTERLTPVHQALKGVYSFDDLKLARILTG